MLWQTLLAPTTQRPRPRMREVLLRLGWSRFDLSDTADFCQPCVIWEGLSNRPNANGVSRGPATTALDGLLQSVVGDWLACVVLPGLTITRPIVLPPI